MRQQHTTIPWGPVIPHETYEGYIAFCERQRDRVRRVNPDFERRHQERRLYPLQSKHHSMGVNNVINT